MAGLWKNEWIRGFVLTIEGLFVRNIVHEQNAHGTSVVSCSNGAEALLAGGIPLQIRHRHSDDV